MNNLDQIRAFLSQKRLAIVGVSRQPRELSRALFRELVARGYDAVPVNPDASEIDGHRCVARLQDLKPPAEGALFMTPPAVTERLIGDCAEAGIKQIWLFQGGGTGAGSPEAIRLCEELGIPVVAGECPFMFLPDVSFIHRAHGWVRKISGAYPRRQLAH